MFAKTSTPSYLGVGLNEPPLNSEFLLRWIGGVLENFENTRMRDLILEAASEDSEVARPVSLTVL
jgi:hypothetical protein